MCIYANKCTGQFGIVNEKRLDKISESGGVT